MIMQRPDLLRALAALVPTVAVIGCSVASEPSGEEDVTSTRQELADGTAWQQSGYGPSKGRVNAYEATLDAANVSGLAPVWSAATSSYTTSAVTANGRVFVGSRNGMVNAYDLATGAVLWTAQLAGSVNASAATAHGRVYVTSNDRRLYALGAATGEVLFEARHPGQVSHGAPLVADGKVYVRCESNGVVYAYDAKARGTGTPLFTLEPDGGASAEPSYAYGYVYVPGFDGRVHAFASAGCVGSCAESWASPPLGGVMYFSPAVASGRLYGVVFGDTDVTVQSLDANDGTPIWSKVLAGSSAGVGPAVAYGKVFVSLADVREMWALNTGSGALVWKAPLADEPTDLPAVANRVVYVPSGRDAGHLEAFGTSCGSGGATCASLVSLSTQGYVTSPVIAGGRVLVGANKTMAAYALP
jgi:serine/threonine-protein kinase